MIRTIGWMRSRTAALLGVGLVLWAATGSTHAADKKGEPKPKTLSLAVEPDKTPKDALLQVEAGHERFLANKRIRPNQSPVARANVAGSQHPIAVVVGCADSRVIPEMVFDQGFGDLFVVRVAGHVVETAAMGSIEYAVKHLKTPLVIVLGHERCGAVRAAVEGKVKEGSIPAMAAAIKPAVDRVRDKEGDVIDLAVREHVKMTAEGLRTGSPIIQRGIRDKTVRVMGAYYDLDTGKVSFLK